MRGAAKWLGFACVAVSVAVLPFVVWFSESLALAAVLLGLAGGVLLLVGLAGRSADGGEPPAQ